MFNWRFSTYVTFYCINDRQVSFHRFMFSQEATSLKDFSFCAAIITLWKYIVFGNALESVSFGLYKNLLPTTC